VVHRVPIRRFPQEVVVLSVQPFLARFWVSVSEDGEDFVVAFEPKEPGCASPSANEYGNAILEAAFAYQRAVDTAPLRAALLAEALSTVGDK